MTTPYFQDELCTLYHGDCLDIIPELPAASLVIADPPYSFGIASTAVEKSKAGSWADLMNTSGFYAHWIGQCHKLLDRRQGGLWVFNSWRSFPVLARAAMTAGWAIESLLVWDKQWIGPGGPRGIRPCYELVALFAHRGFVIPNRSTRDIWQVQWSAHKPTGHPAEKPVELMHRLISTSGLGAEDLVVDIFAGSGAALVAAKQLGVKAIGIEAEEKYCEMAALRCRQQDLLAAKGPEA